MHKHDNTIIVHKGALGDFFLAWPAIWRIRQALSGTETFWHGRRDRLPWLAPLGIRPCPAPLATAVDSLCSARSWPEPLARSLVVWPGLGAPPGPGDSRLLYLQGLHPGEQERFAPVCLSYLRDLDEKGVRRAGDWRAGWRQALPCWGGPEGKSLALLFPGAGHRLKEWPLVKFFELAARLENSGLSPLFVLGPAEVERGLDTGGWPQVRLEDPGTLQDLLLTARLAVGNDSGPMHMAGMLGVPAVAIFGPTSRRQWAAEGVIALAAPREAAPCRPCTRSTHGLACADPVCLRAVSVDMAATAVDRALAAVSRRS